MHCQTIADGRHLFDRISHLASLRTYPLAVLRLPIENWAELKEATEHKVELSAKSRITRVFNDTASMHRFSIRAHRHSANSTDYRRKIFRFAEKSDYLHDGCSLAGNSSRHNVRLPILPEKASTKRKDKMIGWLRTIRTTKRQKVTDFEFNYRRISGFVNWSNMGKIIDNIARVQPYSMRRFEEKIRKEAVRGGHIPAVTMPSGTCRASDSLVCSDYPNKLSETVNYHWT